ncbi:MAG: response regulator, partial [Deltaproteobacteria bacterium]|nr:response regulator [Deltaproteobacteria bacterium]
MKELSDCTILVVDDTEANVDILVDALGESYDVSVAMDGREAVETVEEEAPDLILLDIMMPEMDGYEVCQRLKADERYASIPIIFLTALTEIENKTKGFQMGAVDYITKPFEITEVQARVKTHLSLVLAR